TEHVEAPARLEFGLHVCKSSLRAVLKAKMIDLQFQVGVATKVPANSDGERVEIIGSYEAVQHRVERRGLRSCSRRQAGDVESGAFAPVVAPALPNTREGCDRSCAKAAGEVPGPLRSEE